MASNYEEEIERICSWPSRPSPRASKLPVLPPLPPVRLPLSIIPLPPHAPGLIGVRQLPSKGHPPIQARLTLQRCSRPGSLSPSARQFPLRRPAAVPASCQATAPTGSLLRSIAAASLSAVPMALRFPVLQPSLLPPRLPANRLRQRIPTPWPGSIPGANEAAGAA